MNHMLPDELQKELANLNQGGGWKEITKQSQTLTKTSLSENLGNEISQKLEGCGDPRGLLQSPEIMCFFCVWFACWVEYGKMATRLTHRARKGDMAAIEKLL